MKLEIRFTDQSTSFTHGVEFGRILEKMERGDTDIANNGFPIHKENKEVLISACNKYGYLYSFGYCECEGWINFFAVKNTNSNN